MSKHTTTSRSVRKWRVAILIPTYNEVTNIEILLDNIVKSLNTVPRDIVSTIFILDDNSADGTAKAAERYSKKLKGEKIKLVVINRPRKEGLGSAYINGFRIALRRGFDVIQQMDADLSHNPSYLPEFIKQGRTHDMVIGSRYVPGGGTPDWPLFRRLLSRGGNFYNRIFLGKEIHDYTGGYNQFRASTLKNIDFESLHNGYCFFLELKWSVSKATNKVCEVPIIFIDRKHGSSKIPKKTIAQNLLLTQQLWWKSFFHAKTE